MKHDARSNEARANIRHWHPMAAPREAEQAAPLVFERAEGVYIYDTGGQALPGFPGRPVVR